MSKISSKKGKHYAETKVFQVMAPDGSGVLTDENGVEFTVEFYAPQSKRMRDYGKASSQQELFQNARTNGASAKNAKLLTRRGVKAIASAIKAWHPVSPDGVALPEYKDLDVDGIADLLMPSEDPDTDNSWLTEQFVDFFNRGNFVIIKGEEAKLAEDTETPTPKMKAVS